MYLIEKKMNYDILKKTLNRNNLKKVRQSIFNENRDVNVVRGENLSIMDSIGFCGTPSCICGHASFLHFESRFPDWEKKSLHWRDYYVGKKFISASKFLNLDVADESKLFTPGYSFANWGVQEGTNGFITKQHVLNTLDLLINGETDIVKAWKNGRPK